MRHLGMLNKSRSKGHSINRFIAQQSGWVRASESGLVTHLAQLGDHVEKGDKLAAIADPFGNFVGSIISPKSKPPSLTILILRVILSFK